MNKQPHELRPLKGAEKPSTLEEKKIMTLFNLFFPTKHTKYTTAVLRPSNNQYPSQTMFKTTHKSLAGR